MTCSYGTRRGWRALSEGSVLTMGIAVEIVL
jgi:hypothetical protein